jgi:hypothetical protein
MGDAAACDIAGSGGADPADSASFLFILVAHASVLLVYSAQATG